MSSVTYGGYGGGARRTSGVWRGWDRYDYVLSLTAIVLVLIGLVYGWTAVLTAAPCLLGGAGTLWFLFYLLEKLQKRLEER